jgi:hypothetical protein
MTQFQKFNNVKLQLFADVKALLDVESLLSILPTGMSIPQDIAENTNMCWANVLLLLARISGRKINQLVASHVFNRIRNANNYMKSPTQMPELVDALNLPVILVEYALNHVDGTGVGWSFGPANGNREIFLCNIGYHYQIFVRPGTTMTDLGITTLPASHKLFPAARKIIEGSTLSKRMVGELKDINDAYDRQFDARKQQELFDDSLARKLSGIPHISKPSSHQPRPQTKSTHVDAIASQHNAFDLIYARNLDARNQQELFDASLARKLDARNQQELSDASLARKLSGIPPIHNTSIH